MRDLRSNVLVTQVLAPATRTGNTTSTAIDMKGYNSLNVAVALGASGDTLSGSLYWTLKLTHSDDDSSYSDAPAADVQGSASVAVNSTSMDESVYNFGYLGGKRYVKVVATASGTHSNGTPIAMLAMRGAPAYAPVS